MGDHIRFRKTKDSDYEDSDDSLDPLDAQEESEKEEEVFGFQSASDESDDSNIADSDIDKRDDGEDNLPNERAWGKNKHTYYSAGADLDYADNQDKDIDDAEIEEEEAKKIQQRLLDQFDDEDFTLDVFKEDKEDTQEDSKLDEEELIKTDLSKLSKREKLALLKKESPEFLGLVNDFKAKNQEIINYLAPILDLVKQNELPEDLFTHFVKTKFDILVNYLLHINFYLLLKSARVDVKYHPVVKRLVQYRDLNNQLESIYQENVLPQIIKTLDNHKAGLLPSIIEHDKKAKKTKTLNILKTKKEKVTKNKKLEVEGSTDEDEFVDAVDDQNMENENIDNEIVDSKNIGNGEIDDAGVVNMEEDGEGEDTKRAITYEMRKNKGLTPHRKKEQRNPRVKNRNKYRKAKIRRKGQVREVRKELSRYAGEVSGIKKSVTKSIKIK